VREGDQQEARRVRAMLEFFRDDWNPPARLSARAEELKPLYAHAIAAEHVLAFLEAWCMDRDLDWSAVAEYEGQPGVSHYEESERG
jgi:hypothetical protein